MSQITYHVGDMVSLITPEWQGIAAVVSVPIQHGVVGHVLLLTDGYIKGISVTAEDLTPIDETYQGYAQLARKLIDLGSHVIEKTLI